MGDLPEEISEPRDGADDDERKRRILQAARLQAAMPDDSISLEEQASSANAATETHHTREADTGSGRLEVRCPSCHVPMDVAVDTKLTDLTCSACGSHFSLVDQSQATRMAPALSKLGRFELIERIGVGGFGSVWKARDRELDRTVAIKIPRQGAMTAEEQEKFFREARAAAQLRHPGIVSVHEVGRDGDSVYIVSDFVRGVTLGDWLTGQQLSNREAAELCAKIADALEHAHEQGVVHRDLKPANIMIDGDGEPHLMDFGLARRDAGEITVTMDGQVLGTPAYMSPEQAAGEGHSADRRSDVYSLGVVLFQLLTGELPFRGNARMLVHQVVNDLPPSPRKLNANIRKDLETITLKCLEKDPDRRYQSAREFAEELRRFIGGKPIKARPISRVERGWRWCRRNPMAAALSALLLLALTTISTVAPIVAARQTAMRREAEVAKEEATREAATAKRLADVEGAKYALTQGRISEAYQQIASAIKSQPALEYSRILDQIVDKAREDWQLVQRIPTDPAPNWGCFVGPGPRWFVLSRGDHVESRSLLRDQVFATIQVPSGGYEPRAIGSEKIAMASASGGLNIYSLPKLENLAHCDIDGKVLEIRSNTDGTNLVALNARGEVRVFDVDGRLQAERKFKLAGRLDVSKPTIDISPSGQTVLYHPGARDGQKQVWRWQTDKVEDFDSQSFEARLESDDVAIGIRTNVDKAAIRRVEFTKHQSIDLAVDEPEPFLFTDASVFDGAADGKVALDLASICEDAIHLIDGVRKYENSPQLKITRTRYDSLWPQTPQHPKFFAYDTVSHTLALATDRDVIIFALWLPPRGSSEAGTYLETEWRILVGAANSVFTCHGNILEKTNLETLEKEEFELTPPSAEKAMRMDVEQIAITPNADLAAIFWHEYAKVGRKTGRVIVQILKIGPLNIKRPPCLREFELKDLAQSNTRESGRLILTPDGKVVCTSSVYGCFAGYRVEDGAEIYKAEIATTTVFANCADPPLLAVADYKKPTAVEVFDVATGKGVCHIPMRFPAERLVFSSDGKFIYISGLKVDAIRKYRIADGSLVSEIKSRAMAVAVSPSEARFVGFFADAPRVGSLVLGDLTTGKVVERISDDAYVLDRGYFSRDEERIVYNIGSSQCGVLRSPMLAEAEKRLEQSAIDSELAANATDLLDYRERLAANSQPKEKPARSFSAQEEDGSNLAITIWEGLAADFPKVPKYKEALAKVHETFASDNEGHFDKTKTAIPDSSDSQLTQWWRLYGPQTEDHLRKALELWKNLAADVPNNIEYKKSLINIQKHLDEFNAQHKESGSELIPSQQ